MGTITAFPEKHRKVIEAWVAGKNIEFKNCMGAWQICRGSPAWESDCEYRVKKETVKKWRLIEVFVEDGLTYTTKDHYSDVEIEKSRLKDGTSIIHKILNTEIEVEI